MYILARLYEDESNAHAAAKALVDAGYSSDVVATLTASGGVQQPAPVEEGEEAPAPAATAPQPDLIATGVKIGRMLGEHADFYLTRLTAGRTLLVATPSFMESRQAEIILDGFNPLPDSHRPAPKPYVPLSEQATPFSNLLGLPVLTEGTPLSTGLGFGFKQEGLSHFSKMFPPLKSGWTFSETVGWKIKSSSDTPLSSLLGLSTKSDRLEGKDSTFGFPLVAKSDTPLSSMLGLRTKAKRERFLYK